MSKQTMTIEELIKAGKMESSVEFPLKRYVVVNIKRVVYFSCE